MKTMAWLAGAVVGAAVLGGCNTVGKSGGEVDAGPPAPVRYAVGRVSPAVVQLDVVTEDFAEGQAKPTRGLGSGVIIDQEGHILTNFHVAGRAKRIEITLANEEHVKATLVGSDHWTDLALVKLDLDELKKRGLSFEVAPLGDSAQVMLGQPAMALGTPHGLKRTLTSGIISNTDRYFTESSIGEYETGWFNNWLQTDAAINPGNSGGPLINLRGEVIGINTRAAIDSNNLGFAIPANVAKEVVAEILDHKTVRRSYVGVQLQPLQDLERYYALGSNKGCLIRSVEPDSPAAAAGIQPEDILLAVNDQPVTVRFPEELAGVRKLIAAQPIGASIKLTIRRAGKGPERETSVTLKTEKLESVVTEESSVNAWGMSVRNLTRAYLREKRLSAKEGAVVGVLVTGVREGSPADTAKLEHGDIVLRVGGKKVTSVEELIAAAEAWGKAPKAIPVEIRRDRSEKTMVMKPRD